MRNLAFIGFAYLLGSANLSIPLTRLIFHQDIRKVGSGNPGTANVLRIFGAFPAAVVLAFDIAKTYFPVRFAIHSANSGLWMAAIVGLTGIFGHIYPIYTGFHGGKGVAAAFGAALALCPQCAVLLLIVCVVLLLGSHSASLAAVGASGYAVPLFLSFSMTDNGRPLPYVFFALGEFALLFVRHYSFLHSPSRHDLQL